MHLRARNPVTSISAEAVQSAKGWVSSSSFTPGKSQTHIDG